MSEQFTEKQNEIFNFLFTLDVNNHVEKKKTGSVQLSYLSWAWAWSEVKKKFPTAEYEIEKFDNNLPYLPIFAFLLTQRKSIFCVGHQNRGVSKMHQVRGFRGISMHHKLYFPHLLGLLNYGKHLA